MNARDAYEWLKRNSIEKSYLESIGGLAAWDQRTYLPTRGHAHRAEQMAVLARLLHERDTDPRIGERLGDIEGTDIVADKTSPEAVNVREWRRYYDRAIRIPKQLAEEMARATSECETIWERARPKNDWLSFKPPLKRVIDLLKQKAEALGYEKEAYDALLDDYEPGETAASLEPVFAQLQKALVDLLNKINGSQTKPDTSLIHRHFPLDAQERFSRTIATAIGYDFEGGRLDTTAHPFTIGIGPGDTRITTRYFEDNFSSALFGTIHEAGHAIYEQGLPSEHWGTPRGTTASLGIHESQSRLWENFVGRSRGMWQYAFPSAKAEFESLRDVRLDEFLFAINGVEPSLIRVEADEVTYNLHILLRFELELKIMRGELTVDDLPDAWNEKMKTYFGIEPPGVASGVMQDVHWSAGLIGYFPTYTLGNLYAAQLIGTAAKELGDLDEQFAKGDFAPIKKWLNENVHKKGGIHRPRDLIRNITGTDLSPKHLISYQENKFRRLYNF